MTEDARIAELVVQALALACGVEAGSLAAATGIGELALDSLTLVAVLARIEASFDVELTGDEMLALFEPRTVGELVAHVEALVSRRLADGGRVAPQLR
ncbi:MAG TPA: acyl carrier protein [Gammaproteobacteria bacterium]|nr:acyl carrier protein [Gammaproteobacteria bacterium]